MSEQTGDYIKQQKNKMSVLPRLCISIDPTACDLRLPSSPIVGLDL